MVIFLQPRRGFYQTLNLHAAVALLNTFPTFGGLMIKLLATLSMLSAALTLAACDVKKTAEGNVTLPKYEKTQSGDVTLPKYDVKTPDVKVTKEEKTVTVPTITTEQKKVVVPSVSVTPAK